MSSRGNDAVLIENICILLHLSLDLVNRNFCVWSWSRKGWDQICGTFGASHLLSSILNWNYTFRFESWSTDGGIQEACIGSDPGKESVHHLHNQLSWPRPAWRVARGY